MFSRSFQVLTETLTAYWFARIDYKYLYNTNLNEFKELLFVFEILWESSLRICGDIC